jgi:hypothetical protein
LAPESRSGSLKRLNARVSQVRNGLGPETSGRDTATKYTKRRIVQPGTVSCLSTFYVYTVRFVFEHDTHVRSSRLRAVSSKRSSLKHEKGIHVTNQGLQVRTIHMAHGKRS